MSDVFPCPCCGHLTYGGPPGSYEICPVCYWEDDLVQIAFPDCAGGANHVSLIDAQRDFSAIGACEERVRRHVHPPQSDEPREPSWRRLDPKNDVYLHWADHEDGTRWNLSVASPFQLALQRRLTAQGSSGRIEHMEEDDGYRTQSPDTSREAEEFLFARYRRMTPQEKWERVDDLTRAARTFALAGLRMRFPHATEQELRLRLAATYIDRETMIAAFGWDPEANGA